jgi:DsbC/DsbD-like thiol-disulfide interchange protein
MSRILIDRARPRRALAALATLILLIGSTQIGNAQIGDLNATAKSKAFVLYAAEPQSVPAGKHATLELRFHIVQNYHVNSHTPKSQLLIPTTLTLQPADGVKAAAIEYPAGKPYSFSFDPKDVLDIYAGDFTLKLPVVATPGDHTLEGALKYQACDNASCFPPRTLPVKVVFTAK